MSGEIEIIPVERISAAELSLIRYPFRRTHLNHRSINQWRGGTVNGTLSFVNGGTSGSQEFEGDSIAEVVMSQDIFLSNLH